MKNFILFLLLILNSALAVQTGLVVVEKAVIYADQSMKHPIGYLSQWKQVKTGNVARNGGQVLPIKISDNKVGYMKVSDLSFGRDSRTLHNSYSKFSADFIAKPKTDHLHLISNAFLGKAAIGDDEFGTDSVNTNFYGFGFEHVKKYNANINWYWGLNMEQSLAGDGVSLTNYMIRIGAKYKLFNYKEFTIGASANVGFSPYTNIETEYFLATGYGFAHTAGLEAYIPLTHYLDFTIYAGYEMQKIMGLDLPAGLGEFNPYIVGGKMNFGLAFYY